MKTNSALSYFGSDSEVANSLAGLINDRSHVSIPFVGGASILPHLTARAIVCNDLNNQAIHFYRVLSGVFGSTIQSGLIDRCRKTLSHPSELERANRCLEQGNVIGKAWAYWAQCWIGRKGKGGTKSPAKVPSVRWTASGGTNASRLAAAAEDLESWASHFTRCEWTCFDFREFLEKVKDDPTCAVYCDPPWFEAGDAYLHSFELQDHQDLAKALKRFKKTKVLIRYGDHPMVRSLYPTWVIRDAFSRNQRNIVKGELWITNY